jgi:Protein of unknown function (DUF3592)
MSDEDGAYIRGSGAALNRRTVLRIAAGCYVVIMLTLVVVLSAQVLRENSRIERLKQHGVAVPVTVTSCLALASGTGITAAGYQCKGTFTLAGRTYTDAIGGTKTSYSVGQTVAAVVDPRDHTNLYPAAALAGRHPSDSGLVLPASLLAVVGLTSAAAWWRARAARAARTKAG